MRLNKLTVAVLIGVVPLFGHTADVVTFESVTAGPGAIHLTGNQYYFENAGDFVSDGFVFHTVGRESKVNNESTGSHCGPPCATNGTNAFQGTLGPISLTMTKTGGDVFHLQSFDGAGTFAAYFGPQQINVVGTVFGGGTVSQTFAVDQTINSGGTLNFTKNVVDRVTFSNLTSVTFSSSGALYPIYNGFTLDNISFAATAAIPEPETYAMLLAGLGVMGAVARRRKAKQA